MGISLDTIVDRIEQDWPYYVGFGIGGYILYSLFKKASGTKEKEVSEGVAPIGSGENIQNLRNLYDEAVKQKKKWGWW